MSHHQSTLQLLGAADRPAPSIEVVMCAGGCGQPVRFTTGAFGSLVAAPCDACASRDGTPPIAVVRRTVADVERDLAEVLLFFTTTWGPGTSRQQRRELKAKVDALLAVAELPPLERPRAQKDRVCLRCRETSLNGHARICDACRALPAPKRAWKRKRPRPTCETCGVLLFHRGGRRPTHCAEHRPPKPKSLHRCRREGCTRLVSGHSKLCGPCLAKPRVPKVRPPRPPRVRRNQSPARHTVSCGGDIPPKRGRPTDWCDRCRPAKASDRKAWYDAQRRAPERVA